MSAHIFLLNSSAKYLPFLPCQFFPPLFSQTFKFPSVSNIPQKKLVFQAWHFDRVVVTNPPIGEVTIDLSKYDLEKPVEEWHRFKEVDLELFRLVRAAGSLGVTCFESAS